MKMQLFLNITILSIIICKQLFGETIVTINDSVILDDCIPFGINMNGDTYYDSPHLKVHNKHNFEGSQYRQCIDGEVQTNGFVAHSLVFDDNFSHGWGSILVGGTWTIISGLNKWESGKIVSVESIVQNGTKRPLFVLDKELTPEDNSAILVERIIPNKGAIPVGYNNSFFYDSSKCRAVCGDSPEETFGSCALQMDGSHGQCHYRACGHANRVTFNITGEWLVRFYAKQVDSSAKLTLKGGNLSKIVPLTSDWEKYEITFSIGDNVDKLWFAFLVDNGRVLLDDIQTEKKVPESNNKTVFLNQTVDMLKFIQPGIVRYLRMGGQTLENTIRPPLESLAYTYDPWGVVHRQTDHLHDDFSLHELFELCAHIGAEPWYSLPGTITREEVNQFMEYLAAPSTVGFGALRASLGQTTPWTDVFNEIHVEFGNEVRTFRGANFSGKDYWHDLIEAGKSSPYFRNNIKFRISQVGAWFVKNYHTNADYNSIATYRIYNLWSHNFNTLHADNNTFFRWVLSDPFYAVSPKGTLYKQYKSLEGTGVETTVYEGNYHTTYGDAEKSHYNKMVSSIGGALGYAHGMMLWLKELKMRRQCFFNMSQKFAAGFTKHKGIQLWGAIISSRPDSLHIRPSGILLSALNRSIEPEMLDVHLSANSPVFSAKGPYEEGIEKVGEIDSLTNVPIINAYAFRSKIRKSIVLFNLDINDSQKVSLSFNGEVIDKKARILQTQATSLTANNEFVDKDGNKKEQEVTLIDSTVGNFLSGYKVTLPPYSLTSFSWQHTQNLSVQSAQTLPHSMGNITIRNGFIHLRNVSLLTSTSISLFLCNGQKIFSTKISSGESQIIPLPNSIQNGAQNIMVLRMANVYGSCHRMIHVKAQ